MIHNSLLFFSVCHALLLLTIFCVSAGSGGQAAEVEAGDVVVVDRIEHLKIMTIGINRPKKRNCVNEVGQSPATAFAVFFGN